MELGVLYDRSIARSLAIELYAAPSGEPALGPVAFMHRPSAMDNPLAPIGHHWQDATHIAFGVVTGGIYTRAWKLEGSVFNGREPDDNRWNFDPIRFDSYSEDLVLPTSSFAPDRLFSVSTISLGYIHELGRGYGMTLGLGAQGIINLVPSSLETFYGSRTPLGDLIFLRLRSFRVRPSMTEMKSMPGM